MSCFYTIGSAVPALELNINWDQSLCLVFPYHVQELYRKLFRLLFLLLRTRFLLTEKRLQDHSLRKNLQQMSAVWLMQRFVRVSHSFVFVSVVEEARRTLVEQLQNVRFYNFGSDTVRNLPCIYDSLWYKEHREKIRLFSRNRLFRPKTYRAW